LLTNETQLRDRSLCLKLSELASHDRDYWAFRGNARRDHGHGLMQYPAMMVPQMVRALLGSICEVEGTDIGRIADPFVGSGTVLTEAMLRGLSFIGQDINPLAILLCRVKAGPIFPEALRERTEEAVARIRRDKSRRIGVGFPGRDKWFESTVQVDLSRIQRAIRLEGCCWARRFLWVALAETVRLTSNSRTSTFKLHVRPAQEIQDRKVEAISTFERVVKGNLDRMESLGEALRENSLLCKGHYRPDLEVRLADSSTPSAAEDKADIIVTSPPYGDNATTVPYGQYSYLPLQWIDLADIDPEANAAYLRTTHEIDRRSLGGTKSMSAEAAEELRSRSATLRNTLDVLAPEKPDRARRVRAFVRDLDSCLPTALGLLRPGGLAVWVLGNRRVGGRFVPLDEILVELLATRGATLVTKIKRRIPSKRMAIRNSVAATMSNETILVVRKASEHAED
jgi:hypothetical protein